MFFICAQLSSRIRPCCTFTGKKSNLSPGLPLSLSPASSSGTQFSRAGEGPLKREQALCSHLPCVCHATVTPANALAALSLDRSISESRARLACPTSSSLFFYFRSLTRLRSALKRTSKPFAPALHRKQHTTSAQQSPFRVSLKIYTEWKVCQCKVSRTFFRWRHIERDSNK